jgi:hypothetical protein
LRKSDVLQVQHVSLVDGTTVFVGGKCLLGRALSNPRIKRARNAPSTLAALARRLPRRLASCASYHHRFSSHPP